MVRPDRIAQAAGGLITKAALGCIGLLIMIGWSTPPPEPVDRASSQPGDPENTAMTVMLHVPEGALAKHLTVVDASGRELAILTHWISGMTSVVSCRSDGTGVSYILNSNGTATMLVRGTARVTTINSQKDGTTQVSHRVVPTRVDPGTKMSTESPPGSDERLRFGSSVGGNRTSPGVAEP
jgi:hypothetical protein